MLMLLIEPKPKTRCFFCPTVQSLQCRWMRAWGFGRVRLHASNVSRSLILQSEAKKRLCLGIVHPWALQCVGGPSEGLCCLARKRVLLRTSDLSDIHRSSSQQKRVLGTTTEPHSSVPRKKLQLELARKLSVAVKDDHGPGVNVCVCVCM
jgi:hypothetical protein